MSYRTYIESGSVPLIVGLALMLGALGASNFVALNFQGLKVRTVPLPGKVSVEAPIVGQAAVIYDPTTGSMLFTKNEELQLPLASLTKLMTAAAVLETVDPSTRVSIKAADLRSYGDSGLRPGDIWSIGNLVKFGLVASSNDAIAAAASSAGGTAILDKMNDTAHELGLAQTYFLDPTGLDLTPNTAGAYGSARDMALLAAEFLKRYPEVLEVTAHNAVSVGQGLTAESTSVPIHDIPGLVGAKTGYTDLAGGNLVAVFDLEIGHPVIAVVLNSTEEGRFEDMRALLEAAREEMRASHQ